MSRFGAVGWPITSWAGVLLAAAGCQRSPRPLFDRLPVRTTGISFVNELPETPDLNILNYLNYYNGGGVAAGDIDGDGLADLYFTSNLGPDRLYRNRSDFRFEDISERAGVGSAPGWTSGVTMADIDGDGDLDIYVSTVTHLSVRGSNVLYLNNGDGTFRDATADFGLGHTGYATQAAFFDYDGDGDLDAFLLNHSTHEERALVYNPERGSHHPAARDRLLRNDGNRFVDVSDVAGVAGGVEGYGLGVVVSDLDLDGCPDLFVANDFHEGDYLYRNNCDGSFTESIRRSLGHTSLSSMGVDAADFNNDGRPDLVVVDMLPEREEILKSSVSSEDFTVAHLKQRAGLMPQYSRNTLQLNRGAGLFSDIGYLAGVSATDWSWAPLFADLDNDGFKDLFVTNGIYRRPNDLDYLTHVADRSVQAGLQDGITKEFLGPLLKRMPQVPMANHAFRNRGDLTFVEMADAWGLGQKGFSTGATYADLDNDGDLDLVVNNVNAPAGIYRNRARQETGHHYLTVRLRGAGPNRDGIGTKVTAYHGGGLQVVEQMPTRGFQSSVDLRLHFGLGEATVVDSLLVVWPDRRFQMLRSVPADQTIELSQTEAAGQFAYPAPKRESALVEDLGERLAIDYRHRENTFFDYNREPFIPHQLSTEGPALAVADINQDGREDLFVGGAKWQPGSLMLQQANGSFRRAVSPALQADSLFEDVAAAFFDANGDGTMDLYVVSGGNEFWDEQEPLRDRLYLNDERGELRRSPDALPAFYHNGSCVVPADFDGDGDIDLFIGSRVVARQYGAMPRSYLLQNDGRGRFRDVTAEAAPALAETGMVTSAAWLDGDGDSRLDLVVVGEWMPIRLYRQENGRFVERTAESGFAGSEGWWSSVAVVDLERDGRPDLILGNLGLNSLIRASSSEPVRLLVHDFFGNGISEQILTTYRGGKSFPLMGRDDFIKAMPELRGRFPTYASFAGRTLENIIAASELRAAEVREARILTSSVARNAGDGRFELQALPREAQFAPIRAVLSGDFDADGVVDVLVAGNFFGVPPLRGRYDASYGLLLRGDALTPVGMAESNLILRGEVRALATVEHASGGRLLVVARNNDGLAVLGTRLR
jgi:hypothetical protein